MIQHLDVSPKPHRLLLAVLLASVLLSCLAAPAFKVAADALASTSTFSGALDTADDGSYDFGKPMRRILMLCAGVVLIMSRRRLGIAETAREAFRTGRRARPLAMGWVIGVVSLGIVVAGMTAVGGKEWNPRFGSFRRTSALVTKYLASGLVVGLIEETLFRAFILVVFMRGMRTSRAVLASSFIYAILHFFDADVRVTAGFDPWIGFRAVAHCFSPLIREFEVLRRPDLWDRSIVPPLVGLTLLGVVLADSFLRSGCIFLSVGLHAGWVFGIKVAARFVSTSPDAPRWLFGGKKLINGVMGWVLLLLTWLVITRMVRRELPPNEDDAPPAPSPPQDEAPN